MNTDLKKRFSIPDRNCRRKKRKREPLPLGREKKKAWEEDGEIKGSTARLGLVIYSPYLTQKMKSLYSQVTEVIVMGNEVSKHEVGNNRP